MYRLRSHFKTEIMEEVNLFLGRVCQLSIMMLAKLFHHKGRILMLHDIGGSDEFSISEGSFRQLINKIKLYNVIRLENWANEENFIALSFDDVPQSFYNIAFPILKEHRIPFTIFVSVSLLDKEGYITVDQLKEIASCDLCTLGSHGVEHVFYRNLTHKQLLKEYEESQSILSKIVDRNVDVFAFPYGSFYACGFCHKSAVLRNYKYGFGTVQIPITIPSLLPDWFLPRINVDSSFVSEFK